MKCKFCGAEMLPGTKFCVKCGKNNDEKIVDDAVVGSKTELTESEQTTSSTKKTINLKAILIPVLLVIIVAIVLVIALVIPCSSKATFESGKYEECINISFSAFKIIPIGKEPELYISVDGGDFEIYSGQEYFLNQVRKYSFDIYTVNGAGIKSSEKHFEYDMNVPLPKELRVNVSPGIYDDYQDIEIRNDDGSTIYYTLDGSVPDESSNIYETPIHLENGKTIIKALAINDEGTVGEEYQWEYELRLPIPAEVSFSIASGLYYTPIEVELKSDSGATIYYTTDGSNPTNQSNVYTEPLCLEKGIYTLKAMAINEYNMPCELTEANYAVTLQKYARYQRSTVADRYYASVGDSGNLVAFDSQMNESETYNVNGVVSIYSDGIDVYYLAENTLYKLETEKNKSTKLIEMYIDNFAVVNETIYIEASNILYSMELSGNDLSKYEGMDSCSILGCWNDTLYCKNEGKIHQINSNGETILDENLTCSEAFVIGNMIYYIDNEQSLICKKLDDGSEEKLLNADSEYYNLDPSFELLNTTDKSEIVTSTYVNLAVCNNTLYVLKRVDDEYRTYHIISKNTDVSSSTSYRWYAINLLNHSISDTNITTSNFTLFDDYIIDGYGNRSQVIQ